MDNDKIINEELSTTWYICLSDDEICPEGFRGYIFPDNAYTKNIAHCKNVGADIIIIPNWLNSNDDIDYYNDYIRNIRLHLIKHLSEKLNELHNTDYLDDEWYVMLGEWLCYYIPQFLDKYKRIQAIRDLNLQCSCTLYDIGALNPPTDYGDYLYAITNSEKYQKYLYSELISVLDTYDWLHVLKYDSYKYEHLSTKWNKKVIVRNAIYDAFFKAIHLICNKNDKVVIHGGVIPNKYLSRICFNNLGEITNYLSIVDTSYGKKFIPSSINMQFRISDIQNDSNQVLYNALQKVVLRDMPCAYIESREAIKKKAKSLYKYGYKNVRAIMFSSSGVCSDEVFKAYLMDVKHNCDGKLYVIQHGGDYGIDKSDVETIEAEMSDFQYTWGWKMEYTFPCKCIPMPATLLLDRISQEGKRESGNGKILFIDYSFPRHLSIYFREAILFHEDLIEKMTFFSKLNNHILPRLRVRLFPNDYGWMIKDRILNINGNVQFDDEPNFYKSLLSSELCILPCCSTTFIEAMAANIPCIAYRRPGLLEDCAKDVFFELESVGILCNDWETLRHKTESVADDILRWWNNTEVQTARKHFCEAFAYLPNGAMKLWEEEILRLKGDGMS